jgi:hypothetical protein
VVPPSFLEILVRTYNGRWPSPVRFRPASWYSAIGRGAGEWLTRDDLTYPSATYSGDRIVSAEAVERACRLVMLDEPDELRRAFVLVMAWGSGTSAPRSYRNTAAALGDRRLDSALRDTASLCREDDISGLEDAYRIFHVDGIGRSFFTKWFRFVGRIEGRRWQPLILDNRVLATLNESLHVSTTDLAKTNWRAARYRAYVETLHYWAAYLSDHGIAADAHRLEWILFCHNGLADLSTPSGRC